MNIATRKGHLEILQYLYSNYKHLVTKVNQQTYQKYSHLFKKILEKYLRKYKKKILLENSLKKTSLSSNFLLYEKNCE